MTRSASRVRARVLVLVSCAGLLLALGVYVAVDGAMLSKPDTRESTFVARASQVLFARKRDQPKLSAESADVSGRVLTSAGAPIAGARVCCACASCPMTSNEAARCTLSDAQGGFAIALTSKAAFVLSAQAPGFVTGYAHGGEPFYVEPGTRMQLELRLSEGQENLAGSVIDALGGPVARARIKIIRFVDALTPTVEVLADDEGRFSASVPPGSVTLRAEAEGYAPSTAGHVAPSRNIVLALTPESIVHGTVVEAGTGKRLAGVSIFAHPPTAAPKHPQTTSDESGEFEVRGLEPGRYTFAAEGDHHRGETAQQVEVGLTERVVDVQIEAQPAALVSGRVEIVGSGAPCPQGRAVLGPASPLSIPVDATAEQAAQDDVASVAAAIEHDGTVRFRGVPAGRYHVMVQCLHHIYESGPALVDVRETNQSVLWKVRPGGGLRVHVVDGAGQPVADARLSLEFPEQNGRRGMMPLLADRNGEVSTPRNMRPGAYRIHADPMYGAAPVSAEIPPKGGVTERTLTLPGSAEILVSVESASGEPVDDVRVVAIRAIAQEAPVSPLGPQGAAASSKALATGLGDGLFRLGPLAPASYRVEVRDTDNPPFVAAAALVLQSAQRAQLKAVLQRGGTIRGSVVDEQGGPVANAWVRAEYEGRAPQAQLDNLGLETRGVGLSRVLSDEEGNFHLERLAKSARYDLRAEKHHGGIALKRAVPEGATVTLSLPSPGTLQGAVVDETGRPATSFDISASPIAMPDAVRTRHVVARDGRFQLEGVPAGRVQLHASGRAGEFAELLLDVAPNQKLTGLQLSFQRPEPAPAVTQVAASAPGTKVEPASAAARDDSAPDPAGHAREVEDHGSREENTDTRDGARKASGGA